MLFYLFSSLITSYILPFDWYYQDIYALFINYYWDSQLGNGENMQINKSF